ncbi:MAG: hypothetical protein JSR26_03215 [Proteobacteria bacterium]|nr:hypothetical protein [Pseudomonadota bacterium]
MTTPQSSRMRETGEHLSMARDHLVVGIADAAQSAKRAASTLSAGAGDGLRGWVDDGRDLLAQAGAGIRRHPWAALGGAIALGVALVSVLRRR